MRYFLIPKSRDLVSHNPEISVLKNGPASRDPWIRDPGIAIPKPKPASKILIVLLWGGVWQSLLAAILKPSAC